MNGEIGKNIASAILNIRGKKENGGKNVYVDIIGLVKYSLIYVLKVKVS